MIHALPQEVIDRIAAGEVVERPASVVKELLENALDARATRVTVSLEDGGLGLIRVTDDGIGLSQDELPLAWRSHATSKLVDVDDLYHIVSYGFRGEALSSIGAVARCRLTSCDNDEGRGARLGCTAGVLGTVEPVSGSRGTTLEVRDLFFNTPARRRFLHSSRTEAARCREVACAVALVTPGLRLAVEVDGKERFRSTGDPSLAVRVGEVYGKALAEQMVPVEARDAGLAVEGLLTLPGAARPRPRAQQLFVNGRVVGDRRVASAVRVACKDFLPPSLQPAWVLQLTVDPAALDVNVHPTKAEVRFRDGDAVFRLVRRACRDALLAADLAPRVSADAVLGLGAGGARSGTGGDTRSGAGSHAVPGAPATPSARRPGQHAPGGGGAPAPGHGLPGSRSAPGPGTGGAPSADDPGWAAPSDEGPVSDSRPPRGKGDEGSAETLLKGTPAGRALQVLDTYILHDSPDGLVLVDQHALHERILYARLLTQLDRGRIESQRLLVPETVRLPPVQHAAVLAMKDELARMALDIEDFGADTVVVRAVPAVLRNENLEDLVLSIVDPPDIHGDLPRGLDRRLFTMACHAAVKAGDPLDPTEIEALLRDAATLEHDSTCPHGRPTRLVIGRTELERLFKRSGF